MCRLIVLSLYPGPYTGVLGLGRGHVVSGELTFRVMVVSFEPKIEERSEGTSERLETESLLRGYFENNILRVCPR